MRIDAAAPSSVWTASTPTDSLRVRAWVGIVVAAGGIERSMRTLTEQITQYLPFSHDDVAYIMGRVNMRGCLSQRKHNSRLDLGRYNDTILDSRSQYGIGLHESFHH